MLKADVKTIDLVKRIGSADINIHREAMQALAAEIKEPIQRLVFDGDISEQIFVEIPAAEYGGSVPFPKDFITAGNEDDFVAYKMPKQGGVPERQVEGDEIWVPTYEIANSVDWKLSYARNSRIDVISRGLAALTAGFVKKNNDDGWTTIITAAAQKGTMYADSSASAGVFTPAALSSMKTGAMRAGGNATSLWKFAITDVFISPEALEDIRGWDLTTDKVDEYTMREIFVNDGLAKIYGTLVHVYKEFGEGQEYQTIYGDTSGKTNMAAGDQEIFIGLDLDPQKRSNTFVRPVSLPLQIFEDSATLHRKQKAGYYAWMELGNAVNDTRATYIGSF
jgi:hypothetical protein